MLPQLPTQPQLSEKDDSIITQYVFHKSSGLIHPFSRHLSLSYPQAYIKKHRLGTYFKDKKMIYNCQPYIGWQKKKIHIMPPCNIQYSFINTASFNARHNSGCWRCIVSHLHCPTFLTWLVSFLDNIWKYKHITLLSSYSGGKLDISFAVGSI